MVKKTMFIFSKRAPADHPPGHPRCPRCGSGDTVRYGASGRHYCFRCLRLFSDAPEVPFDAVADEWTPALAALQSAGEIMMVRLPGGFYGVCLLAGCDFIVAGGYAVRRFAGAPAPAR